MTRTESIPNPDVQGEPRPEIVGFNPLDAAVQADPFAHYGWLREHAPVYRAPWRRGTTLYVLSRHEDVVAALKDPATYSSRVAPAPILMFKDPPDHTRLRRSLQRAFTPRAIEELAPRVGEIAKTLAARFVAAGGGDVVDAFAHPLPAMVIGEMLGVPAERAEDLRRWSDDTIRALGGGIDLDEEALVLARQGAASLFGLLQSVLDGHRERGGVSIGAALARLAADGELTEGEALFFAQFLFVAGHETTTSLLASGAELLARDANLLARLRRSPELLPAFVEEVLRTRPSLHRLFRVTTRDVMLHGTTIPAGAPVLLLLGAANRDARRFAAGDAFDFGGDASGQLAFGWGIHVCLGAPLARLEGRIGFRALIEHVARLEIDATRQAVPIVGGTTSEFGWRALYLHVTACDRATEPNGGREG